MGTSRVRSETFETKYIDSDISVSWPPGSISYHLKQYEGSKRMTDIVDANFSSRRSNGEVFNNPLEYHVESVEALESEVTYRLDWPSSGDWAQGNGPGFHLTAATLNGWAIYMQAVNEAQEPEDYTDVVKQRCLARVDSTPYEFAEDLGELRETLQLIRSPLATLNEVTYILRRNRREIDMYKPVADRAAALAKLWKEYSFAAAPLVHSAMKAWEAFVDKDKTRPARRTAHGRQSSPLTENMVIRESLSGDFYYFKKESIRSSEFHASIYYEVTNPIFDWRFKLGLRTKDIPVTIWELFPLTFMVDRLVNIKNAIAGLIALSDPDVKILAASVTARKHQFHTQSLVERRNPYGIMTCAITNPDKVQYMYFDMTRSVWVPNVLDAMPEFTPRFLVSDITKITDLVALIISRLL